MSQTLTRSFRLWDFRVSHDQLLLRSPKTKDIATNSDIAFVGVEYVELPTLLNDAALDEAGDDDIRRAELALGKTVPRSRVFVLKCGERRYLVVAAAMKSFENDLDLFESSLETF
jgi:hypothetical protein